MSINNTQYINKYQITYENAGFSTTITVAEEVVNITNEGQDSEIVTSYFRNVLNLSQLLTSPKTGTKINPEKAREILDTNIFELLPNQTTRQDQINEFFNEFNDLIGSTPPFQDVDNDGAGESLTSGSLALDSGSRVSHENKSTAYITRLNTHANTNNQGKTLESMRNKLNTYLGDVDNVVQVIPDQRPEYENKSNGFLKIRKPNQAIILRNPNQELEFQKIVTVDTQTGPSFLMEGFTITMWVRFVGKTGRGTLFNFGNPTSAESPYGFRLETRTNVDGAGNYKRWIRLAVREEDGNLRDNHWGTETRSRRTANQSSPIDFYANNVIHELYPNIPTDDLNEWFFICATYNPQVVELNISADNSLRNDKQYWLNHKIFYNQLGVDGLYLQVGNRYDIVANSLEGAKCKVEVISRSDLLRARGYKVGSLEVNVEEETTEQEQQSSGN